MAYERNPEEIGALWLKSGAKGDYLTGEINGVAVVCFQVNGASPKSPTWRVMKSRPKGEQGVNRRTGEIHERPKKPAPAFDQSEFDGDDIAF